MAATTAAEDAQKNTLLSLRYSGRSLGATKHLEGQNQLHNPPPRPVTPWQTGDREIPLFGGNLVYDPPGQRLTGFSGELRGEALIWDWSAFTPSTDESRSGEMAATP